MRRTKIIATLSGKNPYSELKEMAKIFDCARINLSHGSFEEYKKTVGDIRKLESDLKKPIPILFDLSGPKIRVMLRKNEYSVKKGESLSLVAAADKRSKNHISINFPEILGHLKTGQRLFIDDGKIRFKVKSASKSRCVIEALTDGVIKKNKGVNFPDTDLPLPSLTEKDINDIVTIKKLGGDYVALSFIRRKEDIVLLRRELQKKGLSLPVIAKIERPEVIKRLKEVIEEADGVMVARGDLGVELSLEKVPVCQKKIINMCREQGKFVIVATQILETMIEKPEPTRAEVSDIANAIFDGCDALMLSGETAYGAFPVNALNTLNTVSREIEAHSADSSEIRRGAYDFLKGDITSAIAFAAYNAAATLNAKAIVCFTATGQTAVILSKFRSGKQVLAVSYDERTLRRTCLYYGVRPLFVNKETSADVLLYEIERALLHTPGFKKGDLVVLTIGLPVAERGNTNMLKIHTLGGYLPYKEHNLPK